MSKTKGLDCLIKKWSHILFVLLSCTHGIFERETSTERSVSASLRMKPVQLLGLEFNSLVKVKLWELKFGFLQYLHSLD
jgi:hypothetical protein